MTITKVKMVDDNVIYNNSLYIFMYTILLLLSISGIHAK